jgi:hypothetical protein
MTGSEPYIGSGPLGIASNATNTASVPYDRAKVRINPARMAPILFKVYLSNMYFLLLSGYPMLSSDFHDNQTKGGCLVQNGKL